MAKSTRLAVVRDDVEPSEVASPPPATKRKRAAARTINGSLDDGRTEREFLVTMRAAIAKTLDKGAPPHTIAGLMKQARELDKEIRAIDARAAESGGAARDVDRDGDPDDEEFDPDAL